MSALETKVMGVSSGRAVGRRKPCYPSGRRGRGPSAASYREAMTKMPMGGIVSSPTP